MAKKSELVVRDLPTMEQGAVAWIEAKEAERQAIEARREIEDYLIAHVLTLAEDFEGSQSLVLGEIKIKVTGRMNRKVDSEMLEALLQEHGLVQAGDQLFRWKPDVIMTEWKQADEAITSVLAPAITTTPGRPSFDISLKEAK
jgi:hypothetical protein